MFGSLLGFIGLVSLVGTAFYFRAAIGAWFDATFRTDLFDDFVEPVAQAVKPSDPVASVKPAPATSGTGQTDPPKV